MPSFRACLCIAAVLLPACSVKKMAVNALGNALAEGGSTYASDDDPVLVGDAAPFGLKTIETLLEEAPRHEGLLFAAASGFTRYGFAWVQQEADFVEAQDLARATALRQRARKLYRRGLEYGLRGLEVDVPDFRNRLRADPQGTLARLKKEHVPTLYWTAAAWGLLMSLTKEDAELTADQALLDAMMRRALALDEGFDHGSIHDFFISFEGGRPAAAGASAAKAREHFDRALALGRGRRAWPYVNWAETVSVANQDRKEFERLLNEALAVDPDAQKDLRVTNLIAQQRARWLLSRADELFIE